MENTRKRKNPYLTLNQLKRMLILLKSNGLKHIEALRKSGFDEMLIECLGEQDDLVDVAIAILNVCMKNEVQFKLNILDSDIFEKLLMHMDQGLKRKVDLYSCTVMILTQGSSSAQNCARSSGILDCLAMRLIADLETYDSTKDIELKIKSVVYALSTCLKEPANKDNQTALSWTIPVITNALGIIQGKEYVKHVWSLLRNLLKNNENNQKLFLQSSGMDVLLSTFKSVTERESSCDVDMVRRLIGVFSTLKKVNTGGLSRCLAVLDKLLAAHMKTNEESADVMDSPQGAKRVPLTCQLPLATLGHPSTENEHFEVPESMKSNKTNVQCSSEETTSVVDQQECCMALTPTLLTEKSHSQVNTDNLSQDKGDHEDKTKYEDIVCKKRNKNEWKSFHRSQLRLKEYALRKKVEQRVAHIKSVMVEKNISATSLQWLFETPTNLFETVWPFSILSKRF